MDILKEFIKNIDTGWIIQVSGKIFSETTKHKSRKSKAAVPYLNYINSIVENAVLLDSNIIPKTEAKSENSIMMHSMYAVADIGNGKEVLKLFVEELNDVNSDGTIKRSYKLIMPTASARVQGKSFSSVTNTVDNIKIYQICLILSRLMTKILSRCCVLRFSIKTVYPKWYIMEQRIMDF